MAPRRSLPCIAAIALVATGCFSTTTAVHVRDPHRVTVDRAVGLGFEPLIAPGSEPVDVEVARSIHAVRDNSGAIRLVCATCTHQQSATLLDLRGWTPWVEAGAGREGEIQLFESFCGGAGLGCGGQSIDARITVPRSAVDQISERRSANAIPGIIAVLAGVAPAIIGPIILFAPGVQTGEEGQEHPVSTSVRVALGVPITTLGLALIVFGIADLAWPDEVATRIE